MARGWTTPVNFAHRKYRRAFLWFNPPEDELGLREGREGVDATSLAGGPSSIKSTRATSIQSAKMPLRKSRSTAGAAGSLADEISYAIAVTLELAQPILTSIYEQIREKVQARIRLES